MLYLVTSVDPPTYSYLIWLSYSIPYYSYSSSLLCHLDPHTSLGWKNHHN